MKHKTKKIIAREILYLFAVLAIALLTFLGTFAYDYSLKIKNGYISRKVTKIDSKINSINSVDELKKLWEILQSKNADTLPNFDVFVADMKNDSIFEIIYRNTKNKAEYSNFIETIKHQKDLLKEFNNKKIMLNSNRNNNYLNLQQRTKIVSISTGICFLILFPFRGIIMLLMWSVKNYKE